MDIKFLPGIEPCSECKVTKFQVSTIFTYLIMDGQMHANGKAIRPLFADPVTFEANIDIQNIQLGYIVQFS